MSDAKAANKPAITTSTAKDAGESVVLMEPLVLSDGSRHRPALTDLALTLASRSAGLRRSLPEGIVTALTGLMRSMNCYYSNLIEGHDTHPIDIERALKKDYSADPRKRTLQREAEAHIAVQKWIDDGCIKGRAVSVEGILETHRRFCELLPPDLLVVEHPSTKEELRVVPGEVRKHDVAVGAHVPVSAGAVPRFLARFEEVALGTLHEKSSTLLDAILYRGELPRGELPRTLDVSERTANRVVAAFFLSSEQSRDRGTHIGGARSATTSITRWSARPDTARFRDFQNSRSNRYGSPRSLGASSWLGLLVISVA